MDLPCSDALEGPFGILASRSLVPSTASNLEAEEVILFTIALPSRAAIFHSLAIRGDRCLSVENASTPSRYV